MAKKEIQAAYYQRNKLRYATHRDVTRERNRQLVRDHKSTNPCAHCGETDITVLDLHHLVPSDKDVAVAIGVHRGWSTRRLIREIKKCITLCANCHRRETHRTRSSAAEQLPLKQSVESASLSGSTTTP